MLIEVALTAVVRYLIAKSAWSRNCMAITSFRGLHSIRMVSCWRFSTYNVSHFLLQCISFLISVHSSQIWPISWARTPSNFWIWFLPKWVFQRQAIWTDHQLELQRCCKSLWVWNSVFCVSGENYSYFKAKLMLSWYGSLMYLKTRKVDKMAFSLFKG